MLQNDDRYTVRCSVHGPESVLITRQATFAKLTDRHELRITGAQGMLNAAGVQTGDEVLIELLEDDSLRVSDCSFHALPCLPCWPSQMTSCSPWCQTGHELDLRKGFENAQSAVTHQDAPRSQVHLSLMQTYVQLRLTLTTICCTGVGMDLDIIWAPRCSGFIVAVV